MSTLEYAFQRSASCNGRGRSPNCFSSVQTRAVVPGMPIVMSACQCRRLYEKTRAVETMSTCMKTAEPGSVWNTCTTLHICNSWFLCKTSVSAISTVPAHRSTSSGCSRSKLNDCCCSSLLHSSLTPALANGDKGSARDSAIHHQKGNHPVHL
jgi:hypothetical protein